MIGSHESKSLSSLLLRRGIFRVEHKDLSSGLESPYYIDCRNLPSYPDAFSLAVSGLGFAMSPYDFTGVIGLPCMGAPLAAAICHRWEWPNFIVREGEIKPGTTKRPLEGTWKVGDEVVLVDDVTATGGSFLDPIQRYRSCGLIVKRCFTLIDREMGAEELLAANGCELRWELSVSQMIEDYRMDHTMNYETWQILDDYIVDFSSYGNNKAILAARGGRA